MKWTNRALPARYRVTPFIRQLAAPVPRFAPEADLGVPGSTAARGGRRRRKRIAAAAAALVAGTLIAAPTAMASQPGHLSVTSALQITAESSATAIRATFAVTNTGGSAVSVKYFLAGARTSTNTHVDFPASQALTLQPQQSYTYSSSRMLAAGTHTTWPAFYDGASWVELGPHINFTVPAACTPGYGSFGAGSWPPACWHPYSPSSTFNHAVPANPTLHRDSAAIVKYMLTKIARDQHPNWVTVPRNGTGGEPTYWSKPTDPEYALHCTDFGPCVGDLEGAKIKIPRGAEPEGGASSDLHSDRHITVVDQQSGWEYDLWRVQATAPLTAGGSLNVGNAGKTRIDGTGLAAAGNGTASGFGDLAGRVRAEEVQSGVIHHALFIVVNCDNGTAVYPARRSDQRCSKVGRDDRYAPPMGSWLQLDMTTEEINAPAIPVWERPYLQAMATYGMYIGDTGSAGYFSIESEAGNQYTSVGSADPWLGWSESNQGQAAWSYWPPDEDWVGHWTGVDWTQRLRVLCNPQDTTCPKA